MTVETAREPVAVDGVDGAPPEPERRLPTLSPSRAADFKTCPLLFRFRTIDRLPEQPSPDQARGTLVHAVLERLFDLPATERTPDRAAGLVGPEWDRLVAESPELAGLFPESDLLDEARADQPRADAPPGAADDPEPHGAPPAGLIPAGPIPAGAPPAGPAPAATPAAPPTAAATEPAPRAGAGAPGPAGVGDPTPCTPPPRTPPAGPLSTAEFLASATRLLSGYFAVEDPRRLEPAERETLVESIVDERLVIRGYVDRLDVSPAGDLRVVDYKTGGAPREAFEARALFQLKFYALVLWRVRGVVPRVLRLLYLRDREVCDYSPEADELLRFERNLLALWQAIEKARESGDFRPKPSRLCGWCAHQAHCPAFGGTPPPYPPVAPVPPPDATDVPGVD